MVVGVDVDVEFWSVIVMIFSVMCCIVSTKMFSGNGKIFAVGSSSIHENIRAGSRLQRTQIDIPC